MVKVRDTTREYFTHPAVIEAVEKVRAKHDDKVLYVKRIGHNALTAPNSRTMANSGYVGMRTIFLGTVFRLVFGISTIYNPNVEIQRNSKIDCIDEESRLSSG